MPRPVSTAALALVLASGLALGNQEVHSVRPRVAAPGDTVVIEGTNLEGTASVRLTVLRGGALGLAEFDLVPTSVAAREVRATVPGAAPFARTRAWPPSSPLASLSLDVNGQRVGGPSLFLLEAAGGRLAHLGRGSGENPASIGFDFAGGAPHADNHHFVLRLAGAPAGVRPVLLIGSPLAQPIELGGATAGALAIDAERPFVRVWPATPVDADGSLELPLVLPGRGTEDFALQWAWSDPVDGTWRVSGALAISM